MFCVDHCQHVPHPHLGHQIQGRDMVAPPKKGLNGVFNCDAFTALGVRIVLVIVGVFIALGARCVLMIFLMG